MSINERKRDTNEIRTTIMEQKKYKHVMDRVDNVNSPIE